MDFTAVLFLVFFVDFSIFAEYTEKRPRVQNATIAVISNIASPPPRGSVNESMNLGNS